MHWWGGSLFAQSLLLNPPHFFLQRKRRFQFTVVDVAKHLVNNGVALNETRQAPLWGSSRCFATPVATKWREVIRQVNARAPAHLHHCMPHHTPASSMHTLTMPRHTYPWRIPRIPRTACCAGCASATPSPRTMSGRILDLGLIFDALLSWSRPPGVPLGSYVR